MASPGTTDISHPPAVLSALDWPTTAPPPPTPPRAQLQLLSVLIGLLCGALAVGGLWLGGALLDKPAASPSGDAAVACAIVESFPAFTTENLDSANGSRLYAASELSAVAAGDDQRYGRLAEATRQAYLASTALDVESVNRQVNVALSECRR